MVNERASIFGETDDLDVSDFKPRSVQTARPPVDKDALREAGAAHGFVSREATPATPAAPGAPAAQAAASRQARPVVYATRLSVRVREEDKQRFEDLAYRSRAPAGETLTTLLDFHATLDSNDEETRALAKQLLARLAK